MEATTTGKYPDDARRRLVSVRIKELTAQVEELERVARLMKKGMIVGAILFAALGAGEFILVHDIMVVTESQQAIVDIFERASKVLKSPTYKLEVI